KCIGCGYCGWACPFGAPQYPHDLHGAAAEYEGIMDKCTLCVTPFVPGATQKSPQPKCAQFCATKCRLGGDINEILPQYREAKARNIMAWQERV
ncbi:MAG: 4Fe-4S dicluster domain-containing protein, partial [Methanosarcinales archaeon]|nr:4Fe-4S dicluster domain-containing protein [Methanosarcinales archaeon]